MITLDAQRAESSTAAFEFLVVDEFLKTLIDARALKSAFELGLIDRLVEHRSGSIEALGRTLAVDQLGLSFLLNLLKANAVVTERSGDVRLTQRFLAALRYRDLLEAKLDFVGLTITDFADLFTALIKDPAGFTGKARLFELFDYRRCLDIRIQNYAPTRAWMRFTSGVATSTRAIVDAARRCRPILQLPARARPFRAPSRLPLPRWRPAAPSCIGSACRRPCWSFPSTAPSWRRSR